MKFGESVLIVGVGGLGCNLIRCASMANAYPITATDVHDAKKSLALTMGAVLVVIHNIWGSRLQMLISLIGWLTLLKGAFILILPNSTVALYKKWKWNNSSSEWKKETYFTLKC